MLRVLLHAVLRTPQRLVLNPLLERLPRLPLNVLLRALLRPLLWPLLWPLLCTLLRPVRLGSLLGGLLQLLLGLLNRRLCTPLSRRVDRRGTFPGRLFTLRPRITARLYATHELLSAGAFASDSSLGEARGGADCCLRKVASSSSPMSRNVFLTLMA